MLDYAASGLAAFLTAPQVGDVVHLNEDEKLIRLLMMLEREIEIRKEKLEGDLHAGSLEERLQKAGLYHIVVVIHPLSALQEKMAEDRSNLLRLLANGPSYGITFIATNSSASGLSYQIGQQFSRLFVLQMPHDDDYMALLGKTNGMQPEAIRGRGLVRLEKQLYEFQCACTLTSSEACCEALNKAWTGKAAPRIAVMPERIEAKRLIKTMKELSVEEIGKEGEPFNPDLHNAVMHIEDDSLGDNVVAQVLQKGYRIGDRVIRYAMVKVAN